MIVVSGTFRIDPAQRDRAIEVGDAMAAASRLEEGCVAYGFWSSPADDALFRVFEEWASTDALTAHFATDHARAFLGALAGLGVHDSDVCSYETSTKSKLM